MAIMDLIKSVTHPDEVMALVKFKLGRCDSVIPKCDYSRMSDDLQTCYDFLNKTSRSFAAVIQALDGELRDAVCIFYLVLRALDTVEDDMSIPLKQKIPMLKEFHSYLLQPHWKYMDSTEDDKIVLEKFPVISSEFRKLSAIYREVISDICRRMGEGMTVYIDKAPHSMADWDQYCHYVAGLVGIGLSRLFSASGLEEEVVGQDTYLSNSMGLFLQKTNIIRDYLEDVLQDRQFWPKEAWGKYGKEMLELSKPGRIKDAMACLNELVTNALHHIPDVIQYLTRIHNQSNFNFCAIPQVMAIATLERCYNNKQVFRGVVKIRKGEAVKMMMEANNISKVKAIMTKFLLKIQARIPASDPSARQTQEIIQRSLSICGSSESRAVVSQRYYPVYMSFALLFGAIAWKYWTNTGTLMGYKWNTGTLNGFKWNPGTLMGFKWKM